MSTNGKNAVWEYQLLSARSMPEIVRLATEAAKDDWELVGVSQDLADLSSKLDKVMDAIRRMSLMPHDGSIPLLFSSSIGSLGPSVCGVLKRRTSA